MSFARSFVSSVSTYCLLYSVTRSQWSLLGYVMFSRHILCNLVGVGLATR